MSNDLVVIENLNAVDIFKAGGIDPILERIREQVQSDVPDVSTLKGRKEIASIAHKVAKSKTLLDGFGKDLADKLNAQLKPINAERKKARDSLDALKEEVRKPLTEWEEAEETRVTSHREKIQELVDAKNIDGDSQHFSARLENIKSIEIDSTYEEFEAEAHREKAAAIESLEKSLKEAIKAEQEAAELETLRREKSEREEKERLDKIKEEAANNARVEAERIAEEQRKADAQAIIDADNAKQKALDDAEDLRLAGIKAAEDAEKARVAAEVKAEQEKQDAIAAEKKRVADEAAEQIAAAEKREANKKHQAKINNQAAQAFIADGFSEEDAIKIVTLIARRQVAHVSIAY